MASIKHYLPPAGPKAPPLSFAVRAGDFLFLSGIPGFNEEGVLAEGFEAQFFAVVSNLRRICAEAGVDFRNLCKVNVLLTQQADIEKMNELYAVAFGPPPYPARTTCVVQALPNPAMLIEIEGVAAI